MSSRTCEARFWLLGPRFPARGAAQAGRRAGPHRCGERDLRPSLATTSAPVRTPASAGAATGKRVIPHLNGPNALAFKPRRKINPPLCRRPHTLRMRPASTVPVSNLRLTRLLLWAGLWLGRVLDWLALEDSAVADRVDVLLRHLQRIVTSIIIVRVRKRYRPRRRPRPWLPARRDGWGRAIIGAELRRAFRARGLTARITALRAAIANAHKLVARLAHRLRQGLTRRAPVHACAGQASPLADALALPFCSDTS